MNKPRLILLAGLFLLAGCKGKKTTVHPGPAEPPVQPTAMLTEKDFTSILEEAGIPPAYHWDSAELTKQEALPGKLTVTDAFRQGLAALFVHAPEAGNRDDFFTIVNADPGSFGLKPGASADEIKQVILDQMKQDKSLKFYLLPENTENLPEDMKLFPPEEGESVRDFWIWYVKCGFFPGPAWTLVKRDGSAGAYHYGYL